MGLVIFLFYFIYLQREDNIIISTGSAEKYMERGSTKLGKRKGPGSLEYA